MKTEAETGLMQPQAEELREPPEAARGKLSRRAPRRSTALLTPMFQISGFQSAERINFYCLKFVVIVYSSPSKVIHMGCPQVLMEGCWVADVTRAPC